MCVLGGHGSLRSRTGKYVLNMGVFTKPPASETEHNFIAVNQSIMADIAAVGNASQSANQHSGNTPVAGNLTIMFYM